jgi:hypothetical protein
MWYFLHLMQMNCNLMAESALFKAGLKSEDLSFIATEI